MENTCNSGNCAWIKFIGGNPEECPNYMGTIWQSADGKISKIVSDCAPKRMLLLAMDLTNQMLTLQKSNEELRNENLRLTTIFREMVLAGVKEKMDGLVEYKPSFGAVADKG